MNFQVKHPQLEYLPGEFREGLKRYNFHKNMNSYEYPEIHRPILKNPSTTEITSTVQNPEIVKLRQQLQQKQLEINKLKSLSENGSQSYNVSPDINSDPLQLRNRSSRSSYDYDLFQLAKHPAFQQPKFTKRNPKVVATNTINGYNFSPERSLGQYGSMVIGSNKSLV